MNDIYLLARKIAKQPVLLLLQMVSHFKHYRLHDRFAVPAQMEHLFEYYEIETTRFFKKNMKKGMVVVDAGANDGYFTRMFSRLVGSTGTVYAFEPDQEAFELLVENTKHLKNVKAYPYAVSDEDGEATWYHVIGAQECHSLTPYDEADNKKPTEKRIVKTITLDSFIPEKIDMMKIDVEGSEDKVFKGMPRHMAESGLIAFEYTKGFLDSLVEDLKKTGDVYSMTYWGGLQDSSKARYSHDGGRGANFDDPNSSKERPLTNLVYKHTDT